ncbi:MAG: radical SAM protein [Candidatus Cloacimonetes bacterium]|nr:radical SAM protein [Candidatus Cloacimonadota bacterium]
MKIIGKTGTDDLAMVYIAEMNNGKMVEFVESIQPPIPREKKWVLILSTLFGCPVGCGFCDAGKYYQGKLSKDEIFAQIDFLITNRFPNRKIPIPKFKIQFARMGDPAFNENVLRVLEELPHRYDAKGLMPCISTIAPSGTENFFEELIHIKKKLYKNRFQLQFSIHTTDDKMRDWLIPAKKWNLSKIAQFGEKYFENGDRKITLNFVLVNGISVEPKILHKHFSPEKFLIKITPLNPTYQAEKNELSSYINPYQKNEDYEIVNELRAFGYDVIISIGEVDENYIGSNCGQYVARHLKEKKSIKNGYKYRIQKHH